MMNKKLLSFTLIFLCGCSQPIKKADGFYTESLHKVKKSNKGIVVAAHPLATKAGVQMLAQNGNAIDAAVAAAFTLAVVEPSMSGIGGRTQILIYSPKTGYHGIDATTSAPNDYDYENAPKKRYGYPSIGVPGVVKGLTKALSEHGTMQRNDVMAPAIQIAEDGHSLIFGEAMRQAYVNEQLNEFEGTRQHFLNSDGSSRQPGQWVKQKDLAKVLKAIAEEGSDVFYKGWIAEKIVEDNIANGGVLSLKALEEYEALDAEIVKGNYRDNELIGLWMPSYGAITIEALQILEAYKNKLSNNQEWGESVYHAIERAYLDRREQNTLEDAKRFTSKEWAKKRAAEIHNEQTYIQWEELPESFTAAMGHTTHLTVVDKNGMIAVLTQTVGTTMGSKVATPGLGFVYAQTLGGYLGEVKAGQRAASHISPLIVAKDGNPFLGLGAAGGSRIPSSIVAVISRIVDQGYDLEQAMGMPRVQPIDGGIDIEFTANEGFTLADSAYFSELGHNVTVQRKPAKFGRIHAVMKDNKNGGWIGVADPDWEGSANSPK